MTDEQIHNIYLETIGKAEGIAEVTGSANFPVLFAKAVLQFDKLNRKWVGLTDEEVEGITRGSVTLLKAVLSVEAKLKEKNGG